MNPKDILSAEDAQKLTDAILALSPEMQVVMDKIRNEAKTEEEALVLLLQWCNENTDVMERLTAKMLAPISPAPQKVESPLPQMLAGERAQFDGDIPEFRTGPLGENQKPAVPVRTDSRSAVQIGMELEQASQKVEAEAKRLISEWQSIKEGSTGTDMVLSDQPPEPEGYQSGKPAEMVTVTEKPSALALSAEQQQKYAWSMISTTQGRRSALSQVSALVAEKLSAAGLSCPVRDFAPDRRVEILAHAAWQYGLTGRAELQPSFSFVDVAATTIAGELVTKGFSGWLEVTSIDTVDLRKVGWACRIVKDK